jgi:hypothetical protein
MPGFMPGIHVLLFLRKKDVDARDKPGHDAKNVGAAANVLKRLLPFRLDSKRVATSRARFFFWPLVSMPRIMRA